jgi:hypothetical protein
VDAKDENMNIELASNPPVEDIKNLILTIRGKQVLLDSDVAMLYGYEKRSINQAAKRNEDRFPERYRFQLTMAEYLQLPSKSQSVILDTGRGQNIKKLPWAYTEQGVSMLAGLLRNPTAVQVSLGIIDAFVEMRKFINANRDVFAKLVSIDNKLLEHDKKFDEVFDLLQAPETAKQFIFFKGQFYDAFKLVSDIIKKAKRQIIIIDNYCNDAVLDVLTKKDSSVAVVVITANSAKMTQQCLGNFSKQYGPVRIIKSKDFHDRFIIVDNKEVYAFGASLKDLGKKCFEVSKNEDTERFVAYVDSIISS